jgi:adenylate cyclase
VIGGEVNLAARLQSSAELGGILMGHETYSLVKNDISAEEMAPITVKGFHTPVQVYRVLGIKDRDGSGVDVVQYQRPGAQIDIDLSRVTATDRNEIFTVIEKLGRLLRQDK